MLSAPRPRQTSELAPRLSLTPARRAWPIPGARHCRSPALFLGALSTLGLPLSGVLSVPAAPAPALPLWPVPSFPMYARNALLKRMTRPAAPAAAAQRTAAIGRHLMSTSSSPSPPRGGAPDEPPVLFESNGSVRTYVLNRPAKLNALDEPMLNILRPQIEVRSSSIPRFLGSRQLVLGMVSRKFG